MKLFVLIPELYRAVQAFDPGTYDPTAGSMEYTFEQQGLHDEFCKIFEEITGLLAFIPTNPSW
jgi:hypothetical protein